MLGRVRGKGGGRALALYAHLDTVGVAGMDQPHTDDHDYSVGIEDPDDLMADLQRTLA